MATDTQIEFDSARLFDYLSKKFPNEIIVNSNETSQNHMTITFYVNSSNQTFSIVRYNTFPEPIYKYYFRNEGQALFTDTYSNYIELLEQFLVREIQKMY